MPTITDNITILPNGGGRHRRSQRTGKRSHVPTGESSGGLIATTTSYSAREATAIWPSSAVMAIAPIQHPWQAGRVRTVTMLSRPSGPWLTRATTSSSHQRGVLMRTLRLSRATYQLLEREVGGRVVLVEIGADVIALVAGFERQRVEYLLLSLVLFARPTCLTSQRWFTSINNIPTKRLFI